MKRARRGVVVMRLSGHHISGHKTVRHPGCTSAVSNMSAQFVMDKTRDVFRSAKVQSVVRFHGTSDADVCGRSYSRSAYLITVRAGICTLTARARAVRSVIRAIVKT